MNKKLRDKKNRKVEDIDRSIIGYDRKKDPALQEAVDLARKMGRYGDVDLKYQTDILSTARKLQHALLTLHDRTREHVVADELPPSGKGKYVQANFLRIGPDDGFSSLNHTEEVYWTPSDSQKQPEGDYFDSDGTKYKAPLFKSGNYQITHWWHLPEVEDDFCDKPDNAEIRDCGDK